MKKEVKKGTKEFCGILDEYLKGMKAPFEELVMNSRIMIKIFLKRVVTYHFRCTFEFGVNQNDTTRYKTRKTNQQKESLLT